MVALSPELPWSKRRKQKTRRSTRRVREISDSRTSPGPGQNSPGYIGALRCLIRQRPCAIAQQRYGERLLRHWHVRTREHLRGEKSGSSAVLSITIPETSTKV